MTELTAELIADLLYPGDPDLSPDGRMVAYALSPTSKRGEQGSGAIWVASVDGSVPPRQFTAGTAEDRRPRWSPDGRSIAFLSDRAKRGTPQLLLIPSDGGEARWLTSEKNNRPILDFVWSPDARSVAFLSADEPTEEDERREKERDDARVYGERWEYARLRVLSVASGEVRTLFSGDRHVPELACSPDGRSIAFATWEGPDLEFTGRECLIHVVAVGGADARIVARFPVAPHRLRWSADGRQVLFTGPVARSPQSSQCVYAVAAAGGEPRRVAFGDESCSFGVDALGRGAPRLLGHELRGLGSALTWVDLERGALEPFLAPAGDFYQWSARDGQDGTAVALVLSTEDRPGEIWAGRSNGRGAVPELRRITSHHAALEGIAFGRQEPFIWTAPDGLDLDGILIRPPGRAGDRPLPTIVLVHGGPYGRSGSGFHLGWGDWGQWLATAGYAVLMPNPRGGMGRGEQFAAAARGDVGGADFRDVMTAVDAAIERGITDPDRLGIGGWSQGGFMTAWALTRTDRFKAGIMGAGVSDWGSMVAASDVPDFERSLGGSAPWEGPGPHPHARLSPISFARQVKTPLLVLHGERDQRVPLSQAIGFHRAVRENGTPVELVVYPREGHGIGERAHQIDVLKRVRGWFGKWIEPG
jgi:dipeptidyl aminopeptidase/acylaminoacyl peptidase